VEVLVSARIFDSEAIKEAGRAERAYFRPFRRLRRASE
jgi:hypothetical protein